MRQRTGWIGALALAVGLAACSADSPGDPAGGRGGAAAVTPTGTVIEVEMHGVGEQYFAPADLTAKRGDVIRFVLVSGVHNASFPADQNPAGVKLPESTPYLQAPGQTYDLIVDLPVGDYYYHCDPHVALGMIGTLKVIE
jgi:plastocyanin